MQNRKQNKLRYVLEERTNDDKEPSKFLGYEDDTFKPGPGGTANYAFMVYDVILDFSLHLTNTAREERFQGHSSREAL